MSTSRVHWVRVLSDGEKVMIAAGGDLDHAAMDELEQALHAALDDPWPGGLVLDLREVTFIDKGAVRTVVDSSRQARDTRINFRVLPSDRVRSVIDLTRSGRVIIRRSGV